VSNTDAMRSAVDADPMNHSLRGILADALEESGQAEEAARQRLIARACSLAARRVTLTVPADAPELPFPAPRTGKPWLILPNVRAPRNFLFASRQPYYPPSKIGAFPEGEEPAPGRWIILAWRNDHPHAGTIYVHPDDPTAFPLLARAVASVNESSR
jgi:hypothetical protein